MARSAQARLDAAANLGVDEPAGMERARVAAIRRGDRTRAAAYRKGRDAGKSSVRDRRASALRRTSVPEVFDPNDTPDEHAAYHQGVDAAVSDERRRAGSSVLDRAKSSRPGVAVDDGAGFLLGLLAYALFLAYLRHGPAGVKGWLKAKFLNDPTAFKATPPPAAPKPGGSFNPPLPRGASPNAPGIAAAPASLPTVFAAAYRPVPYSPLVARGPG